MQMEEGVEGASRMDTSQDGRKCESPVTLDGEPISSGAVQKQSEEEEEEEEGQRLPHRAKSPSLIPPGQFIHYSALVSNVDQVCQLSFLCPLWARIPFPDHHTYSFPSFPDFRRRQSQLQHPCAVHAAGYAGGRMGLCAFRG